VHKPTLRGIGKSYKVRITYAKAIRGPV